MEDQERAKIIDRVLKLKNQAEDAAGTTEHEAQAFAAAMQRMMVQHKIHEDELRLAGELKTAPEPVIENWFRGKVCNDPSRPEGAYHANRIEWIEELASTVAHAHYCKIMVGTGSSKLLKMYEEDFAAGLCAEAKLQMWCSSVCFVGRKSDAEAALAAFVMMQGFMVAIGRKAYFEAYGKHLRGEAPWQRGFYRSWMLGFSARLRERYEEELGRIEVEMNQVESGRTGQALLGGEAPELAAASSALMRISKDALDAVDEYFDLKRSKGQLGTARRVGQGVSNSGAYDKGRDAADKIKLRPDAQIGSGSKGLLS